MGHPVYARMLAPAPAQQTNRGQEEGPYGKKCKMKEQGKDIKKEEVFFSAEKNNLNGTYIYPPKYAFLK